MTMEQNNIAPKLNKASIKLFTLNTIKNKLQAHFDSADVWKPNALKSFCLIAIISRNTAVLY